MDPKDRAARRDRLRARAVTTTVVATVVAAPVLALWAAYRSTPTGEDVEGRAASASEAQGPDALDGEAAGGGYENAGNASSPGGRHAKGARPDVTVEVISVTGAGKKGAGQLDVTADNSGDTTLITLTATGDAPVRWSATTGAPWLYLSRSSGTLAPGKSFTIKVYVDPLREPSGYWTARVAVSPAGAVVRIEGYGTAPSPSDPGPGPGSPDPAPTDPTPSDPPPTTPDPTPTDPEPTPTDPAPTEPTPTDPPPSSSDPDPPPSGTGEPTDPEGSSSPPPPSDSGDPSPSQS